MGKAGKKFTYKNVDYDSQEEIDFCFWLEELEEKGYIKKWWKNDASFEIVPSVISIYKEKKKKKTQSILQNLEYTPDFIIHWDNSAVGLFCNFLNKEKITQPFICQEGVDCIYSFVEIKPSFDKNNMTRLFRQIQKIFFKYHGQFVNLITPQKLFSQTYTPTSYLFTKTGKKRKITKWKILNINEYVKSI